MRPKAPKHGRIKRKAADLPSPLERKHMSRVAKMPCLACKKIGVQVHHVIMFLPWKRTRRDHACVAPLCLGCHTRLHDVEGNEAEFWSRRGINIHKWTIDEWQKTVNEDKPNVH